MSNRLVCIGHPLLDISASAGMDLFAKYDLKTGNAILAEAKHIPLYKELIDNYQCDFIAGGSAQNTARSAQWISQTPNFAGYIGCVGQDDYSIRLREVTSNAGVSVYYQVDTSVPTGTCAVLIHEKERSMIANLSAANNLSQEHLRNNWNVLENAQIIYAEGYMFTSAPDTIVDASKFACENGKIFALGVSAQFIIEFFKDKLMSAWPYAEFIFGNDDEIQKFGEVFGFGNDVVEIAKFMSNMPTSTSRPKKIVVTRGKDSVIIATEGNVNEYPVKMIESEKVLDLNGAGDAFVGGFLFELSNGSDLARCVASGNYLAGEVIQLSGCSFPTVPAFQG